MAAKATRRDGKLRARLIPVGRDAVRRFKACARTRRDSGHEQLDYGQARAANSISSRRERRRHRPAALLLSSPKSRRQPISNFPSTQAENNNRSSRVKAAAISQKSKLPQTFASQSIFTATHRHQLLTDFSGVHISEGASSLRLGQLL